MTEARGCMARLCGVCCGLTVFVAMLTHGLFAGVGVQTLLLRAVAGMFAGCVLGAVVGWLGLAVVTENLNLPEDSASARAEPGIEPVAEAVASEPGSGV